MLKTLFLFIIPLSTFAYENIALHKSAWQLYPYGNRKDLVNASNAVDGLKTDLSFSGHQCTQSANKKKEAMWRVDLGAILGIHAITIYYRTENVPWECEINTYGAGCLEKCGQCLGEEKCNYVNGICSNGCEDGYYNFSCKSECPHGQYGRNCLQTFSENCHVSKTCDKKTGACHGGCIKGWKLPLCNKECDNGTFRTNCGNVCGHCYQGKPCDKKTGVCPPVCDSGYEGLYCNQSKEISRADSYSDPGPSSTPLTDETEFSPLTGKLNLKVQPPGTKQAVVNQPTIATTEQPRQAATSPISNTFPEEHSFGGKHNVYDSQSELFVAEIEKLILEIEYIKLLTKKVSSEIEILELKKKSLSANCTALSSSEKQ